MKTITFAANECSHYILLDNFFREIVNTLSYNFQKMLTENANNCLFFFPNNGVWKDTY